MAQSVFIEMFRTGKSASDIVEEQGLKQNANPDELVEICKSAIGKNERAANEFRAGKDAAINAIKGLVMKESGGRANPTIVDKTLRELLKP
jgi:aspartyl-tRNA(Asn)/glutamyl-tRNA(Gln) amidotransferase subunit B